MQSLSFSLTMHGSVLQLSQHVRQEPSQLDSWQVMLTAVPVDGVSHTIITATGHRCTQTISTTPLLERP